MVVFPALSKPTIMILCSRENKREDNLKDWKTYLGYNLP